MPHALICDAVRTPIGRYGGSLSSMRADDLAALPIAALLARAPGLAPERIDDVLLGCANQAGEDNRNLARMAALLAGVPECVPGVTVNRLCGSGMEAVAQAARAIALGEMAIAVAGGAESMSRAPLVLEKSSTPFDRGQRLYDTTIGWRFVNPRIEQRFGIDSMPETAENVAQEHRISREDQDAFALRSHQRAAAAQAADSFGKEIVPVPISRRKGETHTFTADEHIRPDTTLAALAALPTPFRTPGTVTAGNASGLSDGACALLLASENAARDHGLRPKARVVAATSIGVAPRVMGIGPVPAIERLLARTAVSLDAIGVIELNEAFAAQALAVLRALRIADDAEHVNADGGAIALGHPLGMSGARLIAHAVYRLHRENERYALCAMCIGVGQGIALLLERM